MARQGMKSVKTSNYFHFSMQSILLSPLFLMCELVLQRLILFSMMYHTNKLSLDQNLKYWEDVDD